MSKIKNNEFWNYNLDKDTIRKILRNKALLERKLKIKIKLSKKEFQVLGEEYDVYIAIKVFHAMKHHFSIAISLLLVDENYVLEELFIKNITRKKNLERVRARIIGEKGKTLKILAELSECHINLYENTVSIIGEAEKIKDIINAVTSLIKGSKQANVYSYLEKARKKLFPEDLGIKQ